MKNIAVPKQDGVDTQPAVEMNSVFDELINIVQDTGQTLYTTPTGDDDMINKAVSIYASGGDYYTCTGSLDAYILTPLSLTPGKSLWTPPALYDGMAVRWVPNFTNMTTTPTIKVGGFAAKTVCFDTAGTALLKGLLQSGIEQFARYSVSLGKFVLISRPTKIWGQIIGHKTVTGGAGAAPLAIIDSIYDPFGMWDSGNKRWHPLIAGNFKFTVHPGFTPSANPATYAFQQYVTGVSDDEYLDGSRESTDHFEDEGSQTQVMDGINDYVECYLVSGVGGYNCNYLRFECEYLGIV